MSYRVPWQYGEAAATYMAKFLEAKHRLMPYLYQLVCVATLYYFDSSLTLHMYAQSLDGHTKGYPMQRAMFIEFVDDRTTHHLDRQYMLGPNLLVAPVFVPDGEESEYYLPAGRWTSFFHPSRTLTGPVWVKEVVPIDEIPVWVRQGSVLCLGPSQVGRPDYGYAKDVEVHVYELNEGEAVQAEIPVGKGAAIAGTVEVVLQNGEVQVRVLHGEVGLRSATYFAGGQQKLVAV